MKRKLFIGMILTFSFLLSGCLYPEERKTQNMVPYEDQIQSVQMAVEKFQEANGGILPIKTRDMDTSLYLKYPIDFKKLSPQFLSSPPGNAFESGGIFQYVLIDVETNPTVKVVDVRLAEQIHSFMIRMKTREFPPFKESIAENVYSLDFTKIGYKDEQFYVSPYTNHNLPFIITTTGEIYVDYRSDLFLALQEKEHSYKQGDDIRGILTESSHIAPAFSLPYTIDENNEPIYMTN